MAEGERPSTPSPASLRWAGKSAAPTRSGAAGPFLAIAGLLLACQACAWEGRGLSVSDELDPAIGHVEQRLNEETGATATEPNSLAYLRAVGERPSRSISPAEPMARRVLTLEECLQLAFARSNEVKQERQRMIGAGGSKLIANSRFLPTIDLINRYEHIRAYEGADASADASLASAQIRQRLLEWGKDHPLDLDLRAEQRNALFNYENRVASIFSRVRRAFLFIKLKERQIAAREVLLEQFEAQAAIKRQRMDAGNLSVKIEVLTAQLNVLNERTRINTLERQRFNRKADLLRLIGLPVGADQVELAGQMDTFGLEGFDMDGMIRLALAQSSELALVETLVAEGGRALGQLRYEYFPDLRLTSGFQDEYGRTGAEISNQDDTWGLDFIGQPAVQSSSETDGGGLGLFSPDFHLDGPDPGWFTGIELRMPVTEGHARTGRRIQARAEWNRLRAVAEDQKDRIELDVRQSHKFLSEQKFQVDLAQENVKIERERFRIQEELRDAGKVTDEDLETFRRAFFAAQDNLFQEQETLIDRQEDLRLAIRYFK